MTDYAALVQQAKCPDCKSTVELQKVRGILHGIITHEHGCPFYSGLRSQFRLGGR